MASGEEEKVRSVDLEPLRQAVGLMARLRTPDGCPWDREQTFDSIMPHTLEETYEVFDAIERRAWADLKDELGDLLFQVLFYSQMAAEAHYFDIEDVAANLNAKLIRRHPHIFGDLSAQNADDVKVHWERIKLAEKAAAGKQDDKGLLDGVPRHMPAMMEAEKLGKKAAKIGFDWPDATGLFDKLSEEAQELKDEVQRGAQDKVMEELGDLLFTAVNLSRHLDVDAEFALRAANAKFRRRFAAMEANAGGREQLERLSPAHLEELWRGAKMAEHPQCGKEV